MRVCLKCRGLDAQPLPAATYTSTNTGTFTHFGMHASSVNVSMYTYAHSMPTPFKTQPRERMFGELRNILLVRKYFMRHHRASRDRWRDRTPRAKPRNVLDLGSHETGQSALRAGLGRLSPPKEMTLLEHCSKLFRVVYGAWWVLLGEAAQLCA